MPVKRYVEIDEPLRVDIDLSMPKIDERWDIPRIDWPSVIPGWSDMSETERIVCMTVNDPFLFHKAVLGYSPYPVQGEWLFEFARHDRVAIFAPVGHGKSICASVTYALWSYYCNCNLRIAIVSATDDLTEASMNEITHHLEHNEVFKELFRVRWGAYPKPERDSGLPQKWKTLEKVCYRTKEIAVKDSTFIGISLFGSIFGRRIDVLILDDILDPKLYYTNNPDVNEKIRKQLESNLFTRFSLGNKNRMQVKLIGTFETNWDFYHYMIENYWPTWRILLYRAINKVGNPHRRILSEERRQLEERRIQENVVEELDLTDDSGIYASCGEDGKYTVSNVDRNEHYALCEELATLDNIVLQSRAMSPDNFLKKYQLTINAGVSIMFEPRYIEEAIAAGRNVCILSDMSNNISSKINLKLMSIDLATCGAQSAYTAILVVAYLDDGRRIPIWLDRGKYTSPVIKDKIVDIWHTIGCDYVVVEANNTQEHLVQDMKVETHRFNRLGVKNTMRIVSSFTGANKYDMNYGLPALVGLFNAGVVVIPSGNDFARQMFSPLINELKTYPGKTTDTVMAWWINEHFARKKLGISGNFVKMNTIRRDPAQAENSPETVISALKQALKRYEEGQTQKRPERVGARLSGVIRLPYFESWR